MRSFIRRKLAGLTGCTSGNATLIVALGMPMLIGGAGLGVDVAQWYMWKRELQFAVDQAAIAGAWARAETATEATYVTRATQEFDANLAVTEDFHTTPNVGLANYAGGTNNSVAVSATAPTRPSPVVRCEPRSKEEGWRAIAGRRSRSCGVRRRRVRREGAGAS